MGIELTADWVEVVFELFEVLLCGCVWEKLVKHMFEGDGENDETSSWWFARSKDCFTSEEVDARDLEFGWVEDGVILPFKGFVEEVGFKIECIFGFHREG